ncbi:unnamed protein product [Linum trigynum]|uniref:CCHC-type domain-containing protein n=1 Tax=Linum trigynum TaxID=586398 RepID=A0AAV2GEX6_9ROSI
MVSEPAQSESERPSVRLTSTNFALWEFQFRVFVEGRGLLGILDGTTPQPDAGAANAQERAQWNQNDARLRFWLLGCVDASTCLSLRLFPTANRMWRHLTALYSTVNPARQFEVQMALARLEQGDKSVTEYFNLAQELWTEQDLIQAALRPHALTEETIEERQRTRILEFLMRLRPDFEGVRSALLNKEELKFDGVLPTLVREETRMRTQALIDQRPGEGETFVAAASATRDGGSGHLALAVDRPQFQRRIPTTELECHHCREKGHLQKHCKRRNFCVYCKRMGHIVLECRSRERNEAKWAAPPAAGGGRSGRPGDRPGAAVQRPHYGDRGYGDRPAYGAYLTENNNSWGQAVRHEHRGQHNEVGNNSGLSADAVEQLVNAALQRSLPTAISAAFATLQGSGFEDGEADRKGE